MRNILEVKNLVNDIVLMSTDGLHYAVQPDAMATIILESKDCIYNFSL